MKTRQPHPRPLALPPQGVGRVWGFPWWFFICLFISLTPLVVKDLGAAQIRDDLGQEVSLAVPPQRIVSLYGGLTEVLAALGLADKLVAGIQGDN
ncbi:MAG: hypothetical protein WAK96_06905, partial [Desulfobaccales bacterium]